MAKSSQIGVNSTKNCLWYTDEVNFLSSQRICTSKKGILLCFLLSIVNYILAWGQLRKFRKASKRSAEVKRRRCHQHRASNNEWGSKPDEQFFGTHSSQHRPEAHWLTSDLKANLQPLHPLACSFHWKIGLF